MDDTRRLAVKSLVTASLAPLCASTLLAGAPCEAMAAPPSVTDINIIMPRTASPHKGLSDSKLRVKLTKAVLDMVRAHYKGKNLPVWKRKYGSMDLEKRVSNISHWIVKSSRARQDVYPMDPAWMAAQIMTESFYYEFAVSYALAVGICQFISPTATEYGMTTAGSRPAHFKPPYHQSDSAQALKDYYTIRKQWKSARRKRRGIARDTQAFLKESLRLHLAGKDIPRAQQYLDACQAVDTLDKQVKDSRQAFIGYLKANFEGRSIFRKKDVSFFRTFDERVLYKRPVDAMALMLARFLRARNGNIIAAAAGYHSGLGNTVEKYGPFSPYGRIPSFADTVSYVSRCLINHHEIAKRMI